jgi:hypothetical protein
MSFFHLADKALQVRHGMPGFDPLYKLGTLYKNIVCAFGHVFTPHRHLSLDEGMVLGMGTYPSEFTTRKNLRSMGLKPTWFATL